jgi:hypothetical protein
MAEFLNQEVFWGFCQDETKRRQTGQLAEASPELHQPGKAEQICHHRE